LDNYFYYFREISKKEKKEAETTNAVEKEKLQKDIEYVLILFHIF